MKDSKYLKMDGRFDFYTSEEVTYKLDIEGKNIFLLYKKSIKDTAGKLELRVDG